MSTRLNAQLIGIVLAVALAFGGLFSLPGSASADGGLVDTLLGSDSEDGGLLDPVVDVVSNVSGSSADAGVDGDVTVTDGSADVNADANVDVTTSDAGTDVGGAVGGLLGGLGGLDVVDEVVDTAVDLAEPVVDPLVDACVDVPSVGVTADVGDDCGGGNGILDQVTNPVESVTGSLVEVCASTAGVSAEAGTDCDGSGDPTAAGLVGGLLGGGSTDVTDILEPVTDLVDGAVSGDLTGVLTVDSNPADVNSNADVNGDVTVTDGSADANLNAAAITDASTSDGLLSVGTDSILEPVTGLLDGSGAGDLGLGDVDSTVDTVVDAIDPVAAPVVDSCVNVPALGVTAEIGDQCGGGDSFLDPVLSTLDPVIDPLVDVCLSGAGIDAEAGIDCDGSVDQSGNLLDSILGDGLSLPDLTGDGGLGLPDLTGDGLSLPDADLDGVGDTVNQVVNPLDACIVSDPLSLDQELGAGCAQPPGDCTLLNLNCLLPEVLDPIIGPSGLLDPIIDTCLGYDPLGFNLDIGTICVQVVTPPTCPPDCGDPTCPPDCGDPTCPPDCGDPTCPPDCGDPTCPPDCGDPTCPPDCGDPTCPPDCGDPTCPPDCGTGDPGTVAVNAGLTFTGYVPVSYVPTSSALPPAAPLTNGQSGQFVPPVAGDGGLLGLSREDEANSSSLPVALLLLSMAGLVVLRTRQAS